MLFLKQLFMPSQQTLRLLTVVQLLNGSHTDSGIAERGNNAIAGDLKPRWTNTVTGEKRSVRGRFGISDDIKVSKAVINDSEDDEDDVKDAEIDFGDDMDIDNDSEDGMDLGLASHTVPIGGHDGVLFVGKKGRRDRSLATHTSRPTREECADTFEQDVTDDVSKHNTDNQANLANARCPSPSPTARKAILEHTADDFCIAKATAGYDPMADIRKTTWRR
ncbi:MAG: hypothetical protein LQ339_005919 [Xanthoria mediterranea]|nr:MAG: hypothetical protein LQ339_005919 [Xanthoria mediterranea]